MGMLHISLYYQQHQKYRFPGFQVVRHLNNPSDQRGLSLRRASSYLKGLLL